jgi:5,5'-dehydrodivanillate O-demethylase
VQDEIPHYEIPLYNDDGSFMLDVIDVQDMAMWITQGPIADRSVEKIGKSDVGIVHLRRLYESEIQKVEAGLDPMCTIRDPDRDVVIELPQEKHTYGAGDEFFRTLMLLGQSKFSPMLNQVLELFGAIDVAAGDR